VIEVTDGVGDDPQNGLMCDLCRERLAEYELRNVDRGGVVRQRVCRECLGPALAEDTASMIRIQREELALA